MSNARVAPYGNWTSAISAEAVAAQGLSANIEDVILDVATSKAYFAQGRPEESELDHWLRLLTFADIDLDGRSAIVDATDYRDLFDLSWDARTQVHEYGGAASVVFDGVLYFSHILDYRVYKTTKDGTPVPVTPVNPNQRFADFTVHPAHPKLIVCTAEDHTNPHPAKVVTRLVLINTETSTVSRLVEGADFYACARFSPDGKFLVWQQWYHPELPWQSAEIALASVIVSADGQNLGVGPTIHVAGQTGVVCAMDPIWISNKSLVFLSDISGYLNPWIFTFDSSNALDASKASPILPKPIEEEFGAPQWYLSRHASGALSETKVAFISFREGRSMLYVCDVTQGVLVEVPTPYALIDCVHGDRKGNVFMLGASSHANGVLAQLTLSADGSPQLRSLSPPAAEDNRLDPRFISIPEYHALTLPPDNRTCHANYYAPKNPKYDGGLAGEKPPVVVRIHGGPFAMEPAKLSWAKQFFTSRGWAYVDINYGGSTGFGRAFRESLHGKWGLLDIADAHQSVLKLDTLGLVDAARAVVHGGSAGGYSVLQIATTLPTAFAAGSPHYGVSDMRKLDEILHKFEYYLCDRLMGGKWEECESVWRERSPIYHVDRIKMPMLFLQGEDDTVVPADQMIKMVETIKGRGGKAEIVLFSGEGHGWRRASTIRIALERQLTFFNEVLGFDNQPN